MRKVTLFVVLLAFAASSAFAVNFVATPMTLSAQSQVLYDFGGSPLSLPLTVTGPGGSVYFLVFTNGQAATISKVTNGYLGWHYVNKIDTCLYVSPITSVKTGANTIVWDGKDETGVKVPAGTYTYYIFGFDDVSNRIQVTKQVTVGPWQYRAWITHTTAGVPVSNPSFSYAAGGGGTNDALGTATLYRWTVGNDPEDVTLRETTTNQLYSNAGGGSRPGYDPYDYKYYYRWSQKGTDTRYVMKWEWVPQGESIKVESWGDNGDCVTTGNWATWSCFGGGVASDNKDMLYILSSDIGGSSDVASVISINAADGTVANVFDISNWWVDPQDAEAGGQINGGPLDMEFNRDTNQIILGAHSSCIFQMYNPYYTDEAEATLWVNQNGDYTGDHNFQPDIEKKWVCNDYNVQPYSYTCRADANMFVLFTCFDMGAVSFGLMAPDGTGMNYQALAGETAAQKYGLDIVDYGSAFDGLYTTNNAGNAIDATWWYVGHDSIKGILSNTIVGVDDAPAAFAVSQNVPNPFNPTTTINFNLAKAGKVTVDVYNVAGQKVDTIVNAPMSAGSHSVTWNASKVAAGMYFYTVKSGSFSKTMKMTLLK